MVAKERSDERITLNMAEPLNPTHSGHDLSSLPSGKYATQHTIERKYEFFVTTGEPHQPEGVERGKIRRLVMRNFFDSKSAGSQINISEHSSACTALAKKQLKSRFRLSGSKDGDKEVMGVRGNGKEEENKGKGKRPRAPRKTAGASQKSELINDTRNTRASSAKMKDDGGNMLDNDARPADRRLVLKTDLSAHRFDPFDVLPVPGTQQMDTLFKLCKFLQSHPHRYIPIPKYRTLG
jgi:hypothetical protein